MLTDAYAGGVKRGLVRLAGLGLLAAILVIPLGSTASAHAAYKDSNPADEASVTQAPAEIWAEYTEPPSQGSYLRVFDPCGEQVDNGDSRPEGYRLYITSSGRHSGTYRVEWFVDSSLDNHPTRGTFTFTATDGEPCPSAEQPEDDGRDQDRSRVERDDRAPASDGNDLDEGRSDEVVAASDDGDRGSRGAGTRTGRDGDRNRGRPSRGRDGVAVAEPVSDEPIAAKEPGLLSDIPVGGAVIALLMTVGIGAAGGFIYAGIMGYHRISN